MNTPKPVRMWGWTGCRGNLLKVSPFKYLYPPDYFGGTRILATVVPDKKPARRRKYRPVIDHTKFGTVKFVPVTKPAKKTRSKK